MMRYVLVLVICVSSAAFAGENTKQLWTLPVSNGPRFELSDYDVWPAEYGQAQVCLWADDKVAAVTITIDDNFENDHPFWIEMNEKYGLVFTWFVMVDHVKDWSRFGKLLAAGHDVQGHDTCHVNKMEDGDYQARLEHARDGVNKNLANAKCLTYAYPCGKNREVVTEKVYIAARGVYGTMNNADTINYMHLNSGGANEMKRIDILLDPNLKLWNQTYHRGWLSVHYHGLGPEDKGITKSQSKTAEYLKYVAKHKDQLWVAGYTDVAKYGMQRDTHRLKTLSAGNEIIELDLSDDMLDDVYDYPLTVRVRVADDWQGAKVIQGDKQVSAYIVEHENAKYAMVPAVPDKGVVKVMKQ